MKNIGQVGPRTTAEPPLPAGQAKLLAALDSQAAPVTLAELAEASGLHPNTLRSHLDPLLDSGAVVRTREPASGRGRPAHRYAASGARPGQVAEVTGLAIALAEAVTRASASPAEEARRAGRGWGRRLAQEPGQSPGVRDVLERMGFSPQPDHADASVFRLTRCPLLAAARTAPEVVCGVHRGLVEGLLHRTGADTGVELEPFAEVGACRLRVEDPA
ncbi:helix-turn-helix transcriptional regulator [Actinophytocola sp. NPDC049390]|uniref:helix-turn-helix transcriptional regulator n=1 Tax=Actinophytocola sp. NPDC049390 TaxID=3363894 RepID=UPI00379ECEDB